MFLRKEDEEAERRLALLPQALLREPVAPPQQLQLKHAVLQHLLLRQVEEVVRRSTLRGPGFPSSLKTGLNGCLRIRRAPASWAGEVAVVVVVVAVALQLAQAEVGPQCRQLLRILAESTGLVEACVFRED